jgi:hypothetical protein
MAMNSSDEAGSVIITLSSGAQITSPDNIQFQYQPAGVISSVTPSIGTVGTRVYINGTNLLGGGTSVQSITLNGILADVISFSNKQMIVRANIDYNSTAAGPVIIVSDTGAIVEISNGWMYEELGNISSINPLVGQQGLNVTIEGYSLIGSSGSGIIEVTLAGIPATILHQSDAMVTVRAGYGNESSGPVIVTTLSGSSITSDANWSYYQSTISSIYPMGGVNGTHVTINGINLTTHNDSISQITFGDIKAYDITVLSYNSVSVRAGYSPISTGPLTVGVNLTSGIYLTLNDGWSYDEPGVITSIHPSVGLPGTNITIYGTSLVPPNVTGVSVMVGRSGSFRASVINSSVVQFTAGVYQGVDVPGIPLPLTIISYTGSIVYNESLFIYNITSNVTDVRPVAGGTGSIVRINVSNVSTIVSNVLLAGVPAAEIINITDDVISDVTPPLLINYIFDLNLGIITLNFTEAVNTATLNVSGITLYSTNNTNDTIFYQFSLPTGKVDMNQKIINISISHDNLNAIKADYKLATEINNTYLYLDSGTIYDMSLNAINDSLIATQPTTFIEDTTSPRLVNVTFNYNGGILALTFSETVNVETFVPTELTLQQSVSPPTESLVLTGGNFTMKNSTVILVTLLPYDLNRIKEMSPFFNDTSLSFVSITNETIQDMNGNYVEIIPFNSALKVSSITHDSIDPEIISFDFDVDQGQLTIYFNEAVDTSTLDVTQLTLVNDQFNSSSEYNFKGYKSIMWHLTHVQISLLTNDLNQIKLIESLATNENTTYLAYTSNTVIDRAGNSLIPTNGSEGIPVSIFIPDTTQPSLESFNLDFSGKPQVLTLTFDEPVMYNSINFTTITLQSVANTSDANSTEFHTLSGGDVTSPNGLSVTIELDFIDVVTIQSLRNLAIDADSTFISLENGTSLDMAGNPSTAITDDGATRVSSYQTDAEKPTLESFSFDADSGQLSLTFSESIDYGSFDVSDEIVLHAIPDFLSEAPGVRLSGGNVSPFDWYIINITLTEDDFNKVRLQAPFGLCTNVTDCYLNIQTSDAIRDTAGRYLDAIPVENALVASDYIFDTTKPRLTSFILDASSGDGIIHLTFSEPINLEHFSYNYVEFHNENHRNDSTTVIPLTSGTPIPADSSFTFSVKPLFESSVNIRNTMEVDIRLNDVDFNLLKTHIDIATSVNNTYLFMYSHAGRDYYNNSIDEQDGYTVQASQIINDITHPSLEAFIFDLDEGQIIFTFSESVNISTFNTSAVTIQSASNNSLYSFTLTDGYLSPFSVPIITLNLSNSDLNYIKEIRGLASRTNNTYISFVSSGVYDMSGFNLTEIPIDDAKVTIDFIPDTTSPILESFSLNLTTNELILTFDETVSYSTLINSRLILQSDDNSSSSVTLSETSNVVMNDSTIIIISLSRQDLNRIKIDTSLAINADTTQLVILDSAIRDMSNVPSESQTLLVDGYYPDTVQPKLVSFLFDLDEGLVVLNFDEAIQINSVNSSLFSFINAPNGSVIFNPSEFIINSTTNSPQLKLLLTTDDLNAIKLNTSLYTAMFDAYLNLLDGFVIDMNNNSLIPISNIQAVNFTADFTSPKLVSFDFDLNTGELHLTFSETVNASTFKATGITLQSVLFPALSNEQHQLTGGELASLVDSTVLTLTLTPYDLNVLKAEGIALDNTTTWLTLLNYTVLDMSDNLISPIDQSVTAEPVYNYIPDITSPVLINFTLDLTSELLTLTFSETVDVYTLDTTEITLLNEPSDSPSSNYTLSNHSNVIPTHGPVINITLGDIDLNEIKKLTNLGTSSSNTYISLTNFAIKDRSEISVLAISGNTSVQAMTVIRDSLRPMLLDYLFDLDEGQLHLTFSETVDVSSVDVTGFTLHNSNTSGSLAYNLTGGYISSTDGPEIILQLSFYDLNEIKLIRTLATGSNNVTNNTYLSVNGSAVKDNDGNLLFTIYDPLKANQFISDTTEPQLVQYHLDLDTGVITLNFSEAVDIATFVPDGITFLNINSTNASFTYQLTNGTVISIEQSWIEVNLTLYDLNELKSLLELTTNENNTFLAIDEGSVLDVSGNPLQFINLTDAIHVTVFIPDTTSPTLISYSLDMNNGQLNLTFSESVLSYTLTSTGFTVQNSRSLPLIDSNLYYTLRNLNVTVDRLDNTVISMIVNNSDLNQIKRRPKLAINRNTTYLSITKEAINDTNMNSVSPIPSTNALIASEYVKDTTPPTLFGFDLDLNNGQLVLRFSETVNSSTLNLDYLTFKSDNTTNATAYNITGDGSSFP